LISIAKLTAFSKQIRVLESFHSSTNLSKKLKLHCFTGWREYKRDSKFSPRELGLNEEEIIVKLNVAGRPKCESIEGHGLA
jgi:hypothetical protein